MSLSLLSLLTGCKDTFGSKGGGPDTVVSDTGADADTDTDTDVDTDTHDTDTDTDSGTTVIPVDEDGDGVDSVDDCDDSDATVYPGAPEACDGRDNDCDGTSDDAEDSDGDGIADCEDYCPVFAVPGGTGDGRLMDPFGTIQEAVDLAGSSGCNEVRAFQGTYYENIDWDGWPVNAESVSGPRNTIIDGQSLDSVVIFDGGETEDARIYGFTIRHGGGEEGAGLRVRESSPTIEGNLITENLTNGGNYLGGGIRIYNGSPAILDNIISDNDAGYGGPENGCDGGGIDIRGGSAIIAGNHITGNTAGDGGGIWMAYSDALVYNNVISGNEADDADTEAGGQGGGINVQIAGATGPTIEANIIADNVASMYGGGIVTYEAHDEYPSAIIANNTIVYNDVTDTDYGAGVCQWRRTTPTVYNNIVAYNHGVGVYSQDDMDATFTYNLVYGNDTDYSGLSGDGGGNVSGDPLFAHASDDGDPTNDDFTLSSGSPAKDAGNPSVSDPDGSRSDVGAYGGPSGAW